MTMPNKNLIAAKSVAAKEAKGALMLQQEADQKIAVARAVTDASFGGARVAHAYTDAKLVDLRACVDVLSEQQKEFKVGDTSRIEGMLLSQAVGLQSMFADLATRAKAQTSLGQVQILTTLALKAQSGSRATLQALGEIRYPRQATFVKQANIAHGPQQVNYKTQAGPDSRAGENKNSQNELLEENNHGSAQLDTRAAPTSARSHKAMGALVKVQRAKKPTGQG